MKNFDTERNERASLERKFQMGGETFTYRAGVRPEDILSWFQMRSGETADELSQANQVAVYDDTILAFLDPGQAEKWARVRAEAEPPISLGDIADLIDWLFEEQAGRPTSQPSDSTNGSGSGGTGTTSTDSSPSPVEAV